jgi:aminobenzoyl-glutamate utilization protein B
MRVHDSYLVFRCVFASCLVAAGFALPFWVSVAHAEKADAVKSVNDRDESTWQLAKKIWEFAEPGYLEEKSSELLAGHLEKAGFEVRRKVAGIPTAFTATFGKGEPVIGILGEFDALPGLSQDAVPYRQPREGATYGHGCGHHLFGAAAASAAIAIAERIKAGDLKGTVRFYGCPAEEGGSGKVFMAQAGLFQDCATILQWHPSHENSAGDRSSLARMAVKFRYRGKAAHAAGAPERGRSALDAVELTNFAAQLLREHTPDFTRIHHVILFGGEAPNVVPAFAEVYYYIRHPDGDVVRGLYKRLVLCAQAGALATETKLEVGFEGGIREILPNNTLAQVTMKNLAELTDLTYTQEETAFALRIQETFVRKPPLTSIQEIVDRSGSIGKGSTDIGDVSWLVPTTGFTTACWVPGTSAHSWQAVAAGGTSIGRKGMNLAARVLAASAWDFMTNPQVVKQAHAEHNRRLGAREYKSLMEPGQKPPLDYRKTSKR